MLGRRAAQPVKQPGEVLAVFVAGALHNYLNGRVHWRVDSRYRKGWHERVALALLEANYGMYARHEYAVVPKVVTFTANVFHAFDTDGLSSALKPVRDALVECGVISGDADRDGHTFTYTQQINRKNRGVTITVRLAGPQPAPSGGRRGEG